jgi:hypothetical protein
LSQEEIGKGIISDPVECTFPAPKSKKTKKKSNIKADVGEDDDEDASDGESKAKKAKAKPRKKARKVLDEEKDLASGSEEDDVVDEVMTLTELKVVRTQKGSGR